MITLLHNPNNISEEASRVSVRLESEALLALRTMVGHRPIIVVSVAGTTELGKADPIAGINSLLAENEREYRYRPWHHVDAAYGGFFCTLLDSPELKPEVSSALRAIRDADSITLDPHKLGYVPYSSGGLSL